MMRCCSQDLHQPDNPRTMPRPDANAAADSSRGTSRQPCAACCACSLSAKARASPHQQWDTRSVPSASGANDPHFSPTGNDRILVEDSDVANQDSETAGNRRIPAIPIQTGNYQHQLPAYQRPLYHARHTMPDLVKFHPNADVPKDVKCGAGRESSGLPYNRQDPY